MGEAVHLEQAAQTVEGALLVPVVEVEIVEERSHGQGCLVRSQMEPVIHPEAHGHHVPAMLVSGHIAVLDELPHLLHLGVVIVLFQNCIEPFPFGLRKLHGKVPFFFP